MTAFPQITPETLFVAIDFTKRYHDVLVRWPCGQEKAFKLPNTRSNHEGLCHFLIEQALTVVAALEPTADFHRTLAYRLAEAGITDHLASSLVYSRVDEALYTYVLGQTRLQRAPGYYFIC